MTDLGIPLDHELARHDFLDRPVSAKDELYCLGEFLYRQQDAAEFLQFLQFLCQNQNSAPAILRLLGATQINGRID
ncbi:hypothetical protein [Loigolactobacillus coryniformis]|uniref:hypothetical protein n=1 Tax=Loigolactobacillus coryniformis TaxID=1610 RepID=UPI00345D2360